MLPLYLPDNQRIRKLIIFTPRGPFFHFFTQTFYLFFTNLLQYYVDNISVIKKINIMNKTLLNNAISKLSKKELAEIFPPITRNNFVVRENWFGRNQIITFVNNKGQQITYNHDEVLKVMLPKLKLMPCWIKRKYWSQSTDMPSNVRDIVIERIDLVK